LACSKDDQPYIVPISIAYSGDHIYSFATLGQKVDWMRSNPLVCLEVEEIVSKIDWRTVLIFGQYEELERNNELRNVAHELLSNSANWWQPGYAKTIIKDKERPLEPIYFRVSVTQVSGHEAKP
jgi:nitroimidazol reductase NimA-like FMN-containing flavoprotein (pyridoxamine 5'-phosphate oxidase superfamily)